MRHGPGLTGSATSLAMLTGIGPFARQPGRTRPPPQSARSQRERRQPSSDSTIVADCVIESCGAGSKGDRRYAWAWIGTADPRRHLLIRPSLVPNAKGVRELAFYLCFAPEGRVTLRTLITGCPGRGLASDGRVLRRT